MSAKKQYPHNLRLIRPEADNLPEASNSMAMKKEIVVKIPGGSLRCGEGEEFEWGGYIRLCDSNGEELFYWDKSEWIESPEQVIGAIFSSASARMKTRKKK